MSRKARGVAALGNATPLAVALALSLAWSLSPDSAHAQGCPATFGGATTLGTGGTTPFTVVTGDFNEDGRLDAVVANYTSANVGVLLGDGTGGFLPAATLATGLGTLSPLVADVNADGNEDILTANFDSSSVSILLGDGLGGFVAQPDFVHPAIDLPWSLAAGDFDGDGDVDLAVSNLNNSTVAILLGNGLGAFAFSSSITTAGNNPQRIVATDLDGDLDVDLAVPVRASDSVRVYLNDGLGGFTGSTVPVGGPGSDPRSIAVADMDRDGNADLVVGLRGTNEVFVLLGDGAGGFTPSPAGPAVVGVSGPNGADIAIGDVNGDGIADVVSTDETTTVLTGDGQGGFGSTLILAGTTMGTGVAVVDVSPPDGQADVLVARIDTGMEVRLNTSACASATPAQNIQFKVSRSGNTSVKLQVDTPHTGPFDGLLIRFDVTPPGVACVPPPTPGAGSLLVAAMPGHLGAKQSFLHGALTNGNNYCYSAFPIPHAGSQNVGARRTISGHPFAPAQVQWSYNTGVSALATPAILPGSHYLAVSNDSTLHGISAGSSGGDWPPLYTPVKFSGPAQSRPTVIAFPVTTVGGVKNVAFAGSQDGHVYAVDAVTGKVLWASPNLGAPIEATPSLLTTDFLGGVANVVLVGTHDTLNPNTFYALRVADGTIADTFDNTANGFGIVSSQAQVIYPNRVIFTSRRFGANLGTVWSLQISAAGTFTKEWQQDLGEMDAAATVRNGKLYLGDITGQVYGCDPGTGVPIWTHTPTGADVKGFVWKDASTRLYFSTTTGLHAIRDDGLTATPLWDQAVANASVPFVFGANVYVGGAGSTISKFDSLSGTPGGTVVLGDPLLPRIVGGPTFDIGTLLMVVGTEAGDIFGVSGF